MEDWVTRQEQIKREAEEVRNRENLARENLWRYQQQEARRITQECGDVLKPIRDHAFTIITNACRRGADALDVKIIQKDDVQRHGLELEVSRSCIIAKYSAAGVTIPKGQSSVHNHLHHWIGIGIENKPALSVSFYHTPGDDRGGYARGYTKQCSMDWRDMSDPIASEMVRWLLVNEGTPWQLMRVVKTERPSLWRRIFS